MQYHSIARRVRFPRPFLRCRRLPPTVYPLPRHLTWTLPALFSRWFPRRTGTHELAESMRVPATLIHRFHRSRELTALMPFHRLRFLLSPRLADASCALDRLSPIRLHPAFRRAFLERSRAWLRSFLPPPLPAFPTGCGWLIFRTIVSSLSCVWRLLSR